MQGSRFSTISSWWAISNTPRPTHQLASQSPVVDDFAAHAFSDRGLLQQALTHRSAGARNNERLEFLGDALVNLIVADALYERWPKADEGALTRARAELVRESSLAGLARGLRLGEKLSLGSGELKSGGQRRDSILADALEAVVAAVYLDAGFDTCRNVVLPWFALGLESLPVGKVAKDAKTRLQEWLQARQVQLPEYALIDTSGDEHDRSFRVDCRIVEPPLHAEGTGSSRRAAEQQAAAEVLRALEPARG
ncbi:MAG: ribonuclease III [Proteobacteria bacterium]|nr:ribonuclease III [Pseudomonadota bacterium]